MASILTGKLGASMDRRVFLAWGGSALLLPYVSLTIAQPRRVPTDLPPELATLFAQALPIYGDQLQLVPPMLDTGKPVIAWAERIIIQGAHVSSGQPVMLIARNVSFQSGSSINSDGGSGSDYHPGDRPTAQPNRNGTNGNAGANGKPGGYVVIIADELQGAVVLSARGGAGGRGQDGGYGDPGTPGENHAGESCRSHSHDGGNGGNGGWAGLEGPGGWGGSGGDVILRTRSSPSPGNLAINASAGPNGAPGVRGQPGGPGPAGHGSKADEWWTNEHGEKGPRGF